MIATAPFMLVFTSWPECSGVGSAFLFVGFIEPSAAEVGRRPDRC